MRITDTDACPDNGRSGEHEQPQEPGGADDPQGLAAFRRVRALSGVLLGDRPEPQAMVRAGEDQVGRLQAVDLAFDREPNADLGVPAVFLPVEDAGRDVDRQHGGDGRHHCHRRQRRPETPGAEGQVPAGDGEEQQAVGDVVRGRWRR